MEHVSVVRAGATGAAGRATGAGVRRKRWSTAVTAVLVVLLATAFGAASAYAAVDYRSAGQLFSSGADGTQIHQQRLAVDDASGDVLVTDVANDEIDVYASIVDGGARLASFGSGELTDPFGIAVDQRTGAVYVSDSGRDRIVRYTRSGTDYTLDAGFTSPALGSGAGEIGNFAAALAIDGANDKLFVADPGNNEVKRYTLAGAYDSFSFDGADSTDGAFTGLLDLALDSTGDVIVIDSTGDIAASGGTSRVLRFDSAGAYEAQIGASLSRPATVAVRQLDDEVLISSNQDAVMTDTSPLLDAYDSSGTHLVSIPLDGVAYSVVTGIALGGGPFGVLYVGTDVDRSIYSGAYGAWSVQAFTPPLPPRVSGETTTLIRQELARVAATVKTNGADTTYWFEYGPVGSGYPERTHSAVLTEDPDARQVTADVTGLEPFSDYEYRIVADNGLGTSTSTGSTFRTLPLLAEATLGAVTDISLDGATLNGTLITHGAAATYGFSVVEVGGPLNIIVPPEAKPAGSEPFAVSTRVGGLRPGRTYTVGLYAHNDAGPGFAAPVTFTTAARPPIIDPPRGGDDGRTPYGCLAPRLDGVARSVRPGSDLVLTGNDLGIYGTVAFGESAVETRSYAADRIVVAVPEDARGRVQVTVDCGNKSAAITVVVGSQGRRPSVTAASVRGRTATFTVRLPQAGTLRASGRHVGSATARRTAAGSVRVSVRLTRAGRRALARAKSRRLSVRVALRFQPNGGRAATVRRTVVFKR